jgi:hypothetical protein
LIAAVITGTDPDNEVPSFKSWQPITGDNQQEHWLRSR